MTAPTILGATWSDGVFVVNGDTRRQELAGRAVRSITSDSLDGALAIVDGHELCRRTRAGVWSTIATSPLDLACVMAVGDAIYLGTEDARVLSVDRNGTLHRLAGFDAVPGRETWYAGSAVIGGRVVGPPLGVRSMTATADGAVLLVNVHVGGIPRSTDGGSTWHPTIDIGNDVHEVRAHPTRADIVVAAAATGLCTSRDAGRTWTVEQDGLHATYCSAVALTEKDVLVAAATDHFASEGAVYRRAIDRPARLEPVGGTTRWLDGIADTGCVAARGAVIALADGGGNLHVSMDAGNSWLQWASDLPRSSSILLV